MKILVDLIVQHLIKVSDCRLTPISNISIYQQTPLTYVATIEWDHFSLQMIELDIDIYIFNLYQLEMQQYRQITLFYSVLSMTLNTTVSELLMYISNNVKQVNLNSNILNGAKYQSTETVNPWGILTIKKDIWVAMNGNNSLVKYNRKGDFVLAIDTTNSPTAIVKNFSAFFLGYQLITVTESGTIEAYTSTSGSGNTTVILTVPNGDLKGAVIANNKLYITNFADESLGGGNILIYDSSFNFVSSFTDDALISAGFYPFNVTFYKKYLYVSFAKKDGSDPVFGVGEGYINVYKLDGTFVKRLVNRTGLNAPWAMIFDKCGKNLFVGNFGDGTISIYNAKCGTYLGQVRDCYNNILYIDGLWGLTYDCSDNILFAAGIDNENNGLIGKLTDCCEEKCTKKCESSSSSSSSDHCKRRC